MALGLRGFPNVQGGIETHAEHLYPRLVECGCEVSVIGRECYRQPVSATSWRGVQMHWLWAPRVRGLEALLHSVLGVLFAASKHPDVLHIHAIGPALVTPLARALGLKVVVTHHGPDYDRQKWGRLAKQVLRLGERVGMLTAHGRIAISASICDLVRTRYGVVAELIPNGVEAASPATGTETLERYGLQPGKYVLQVSRLVPEKRQLDLIRAFEAARLSEWKLVLVGDTEFPDAYSRSVQQLARDNTSIICTGFQTGRALHELYAHAGVFVLPSSHEGLPIALLEALSYGLRTIASNIPGNLEIGLEPDEYFELGNVDELADRLRHVADHVDVSQTWHARRARILAEYDWDVIARRTLSTYMRIVDRSRPRDSAA